jgi:2-amino-4-ketopentanoate thiolase alpha subunit
MEWMNMQQARKGDWVQIHQVVLPVGQRAPQIPAETQQVPLEMRVKGWLATETANIGEEVTVHTATGRQLSGRLVAINPRYPFDYGSPQPELLSIGLQLRAILEGKANA